MVAEGIQIGLGRRGERDCERRGQNKPKGNFHKALANIEFIFHQEFSQSGLVRGRVSLS